MISARMPRGDGKPDMIFLGISEGNIERLKEGKPILLDSGGELELEVAIAIAYGETEADIIDELHQATGMDRDAITAITRDKR